MMNYDEKETKEIRAYGHPQRDGNKVIAIAIVVAGILIALAILFSSYSMSIDVLMNATNIT